MLYLVHSCRSCRMIPICSQISFAGWVLGQYRATGLLVLPQLLVSQEIFISRWPRVPSNANFCNFLIESLGVSHHAPQCYSPPGLFISLLLIPAMPSLPMKENKKSKQANKQKQEQNKQTNKHNKPEKNKNHTRSRQFSASSLLPLHHLFSHPVGTAVFDVSYSIPFCPISLTDRCSLQ